MSYKRLTPCIFIDGGKAVQWFDDRTLLHCYLMTLSLLPNSTATEVLTN